MAAAGLAALLSVGCQEQLTQPGQCPELCPGGTAATFEEVLQAIPNADSTFTGYILRAGSGVLLVSSGVPTPSDTNLAIIRFAPRVDTVRFRDTVRSYTVDSIQLSIGVVGRDTLVRPVQLQLYRLPSNLDTTNITYAGVRGLVSAANFIDGPAIPDTMKQGTVTTTIRGADLAKLDLQPSDGGRLTIGVLVSAPTFTGVRLAAKLAALAPVFKTYARPVASDPGTTSVPIQVAPEFNTYVSRNEPTLDPTLLTVGGAPASRALLRFPWSVKLRDSVSLVRATLELTPTSPVESAPNQPDSLVARALLVDLGAKSPAYPTTTGFTVLPPSADTVIKVEVVRLTQLWQGTSPKPPALILAIGPEAASFARGVFGSTRAGTAPRLRITYMSRFPFERP